MAPRIAAPSARSKERSAPSTAYSRHANRPQTIAAARNGQASGSRLRDSAIAPPIATPVKTSGIANHKMVARRNDGRVRKLVLLDDDRDQDRDRRIERQHVVRQLGRRPVRTRSRTAPARRAESAPPARAAWRQTAGAADRGQRRGREERQPEQQQVIVRAARRGSPARSQILREHVLADGVAAERHRRHAQ